MRGIFVQHYFDMISPGMTVTEQVAEMNKYVIDTVVPKLYGEALGYVYYLSKLDQPIQTQELAMPMLPDRDWRNVL